MEKQKQQVLAGSLNFLPPADLIPEQDALVLQNWRVDQAGALRSRKGHAAPLFSGHGTVRTIGNDGGSRRYFGAGSALYRSTTEIATGFDGGPIGLATLGGWTWAMNRGNQVKDDGTNTYAWTPAPPEAAPTSESGSGSLNGDVSYWVTWDTEANHESNPSPELALTGLVDASVTVTRPAVSEDPQVTTWNLYRQDTYLPEPYKVNSTPIPIAAETYEDDGADENASAELAGRGEALSFDHDPAPPARGCVAYLGRMLAWSSAAHGSRLWWAGTDHPWYFPGSDDEQDGNWVDVGEDGEDLLAVVEYPRMAVLLKSNSIHRLVGDPDETWSDIDRTNAEVGLIGEKAWARGAGGAIYLQAKEGIYRFNGDTAVKISPQLDPIFKGDTAWLNGIPARPMNPLPAVRAMAVMEYVNGRLYFSYSDDQATTNNTTLVYDETGARWSSDSRVFSALFNEGQTGVFLGAVAGNVSALESGTTDNGDAIPLAYQSGYSSQGAPDNDKHYADLVIEYNSRGRTFTVHVYLDNGASVATLGTITSASRIETPFRLNDGEGYEGRNISIGLSSEDEGDGDAEVFGLFLHYYLLPRQGLTWDSGRIAIDPKGVAQIDGLAFDVETPSAGSIGWKLYTDLPGPGLSLRDHRTFSTQAGSSTQRHVQDLGRVREAHWVRVVATTTTPFRMRGVLVHARALGLYLEGSADAFRGDQVVLRSGRLNLCKAMRIYCDLDGPLWANFLTDIPAESFISRSSGQLDTTVTTSGARWVNLKFPGTTRARAARIELVASAPARIYGLEIRAKALGEGLTSWQWIDVPIARTPPGFEWIPITQPEAV